MSDFVSYEATASLEQLTFSILISVETPFLKRALMTELAKTIKGGDQFRATKQEFLNLVTKEVVAHGMSSLTRPEPIECTGIPDGLDGLLRSTNLVWQEIFPETVVKYTFSVPLNLTFDDLVMAYACAISAGFVDGMGGDAPEETDAYRMLHYVMDACVSYGKDYARVAYPSDVEVARATADRVLRHLDGDFVNGVGVHIGTLEF